MEIGNVIIADGRVGVVAQINSQVRCIKPNGSVFAGDWKEVIKYSGVYLDGVDFNVSQEKCVLLDNCLNDYINRHVRKFGKLKVANKGKKNG
jgi:hypothetical protein